MADPGLLTDLWYFAMAGRRLKKGKTVSAVIAGEPILFGRDADGKVFAVRDICPHRGMPLSYGKFDGREIECCYHGWRFDRTGTCTAIPALSEKSDMDCTRIRVRRYPCEESQGIIWLFLGADDGSAPPVPRVPEVDDRTPNLSDTVELPCHADHGIIGLIDPAHGPFVHRSWWWRSGKNFREKAKKFAVHKLGFTMVTHVPSSNSPAYRLLSGKGERSVEIDFQLPGLRSEVVRFGKHRFVGYTAVTPTSLDKCVFHHSIYWTTPKIGVAKPFVAYFMRKFLKQDATAFAKQRDGLAHNPPLMLIDQADQQAKWFLAIKREWEAARKEGRELRRVAEDATLHYRS